MTSRAVLVADDNLTVQRTASEMLSEEGLEVVTVANGMAAIKKLPDVKPLVVLADADMPGKDGYEVCEFVKGRPDLAHVRVLLAVSDADPFDPVRGAQARVDGVIKKPFDREDLVSAVVKSLSAAQALCPPPPVPDPYAASPWESGPAEFRNESAGEQQFVDLQGQHEFSSGLAASSAVPAFQDFEFTEPSGPPIVEWPAGRFNLPGETRLEPLTPMGERSLVEGALVLPDVASNPPEFHGNAAGHFAAQNGTRGETDAAFSADPSLIASVVRRVVARMAPPALTPEAIEGLEQRLTEEIVRQLKPPAAP